jgi:hypothetical protein
MRRVARWHKISFKAFMAEDREERIAMFAHYQIDTMKTSELNDIERGIAVQEMRKRARAFDRSEP